MRLYLRAKHGPRAAVAVDVGQCHRSLSACCAVCARSAVTDCFRLFATGVYVWLVCLVPHLSLSAEVDREEKRQRGTNEIRVQ